MALLQLHHKLEDGTTNFCAQKDVKNYGEIKKFINEAEVTHPLPPKATWLAVEEGSPLFAGVADQGLEGEAMTKDNRKIPIVNIGNKT